MEAVKKEFNQLYDHDAYLAEAEVLVTYCEKMQEKHASGATHRIACETTIFYPEGGGQAGDIGFLGNAKVLDTQWEEVDFATIPIILHYTNQAIDVGTKIKARIDWERRFDFMQQHSGEHILSGLAHKHFQFDNVGFHLGEEYTTLDFNGILSEEDLEALVTEANAIIWKNIPIQTSVYSESEARTIDYRSKLELEGNVRLISVAGADLCACSAPHLHSTGEIGLLFVTKMERFRQGVRLYLLCGGRAHRYLSDLHRVTNQLTQHFSLPYTDLFSAVEKIENALTESQEQLWTAMNTIWDSHYNKSRSQIFFLHSNIYSDRFIKYKLKNSDLEDNLFLLVLMESKGQLRFFLREASPTSTIIQFLRENYSAKGGGPAQLAQGQIPCQTSPLEKVLEIAQSLQVEWFEL